MKKLKAALLGLGQRGMGYLHYVLLDMKEIEIVAISDTYKNRVDEAYKLCSEKKHFPNKYTDSLELLNKEELDCVFVMTPWISHIELSIEAMNRNIPVAMEVGGAYDIEELWELVRCYEKTKTPFYMLENCCFGRLELLAKNMNDKNLFGTIVHASGGYMHDLRDEITEGYTRKHYRLDNYRKRNVENYPTHEIGPIAKILNINNGNRFISLSSHSSSAHGLKEYMKENLNDKNKDAINLEFKQSDIVITNIKCANGELITIKLDTTLPRYYSRGFFIQGTKGLINEENNSVFLEKDTSLEDHFKWNENFNNMDKYYEEYEHPIWEKYLEDGVKKGHGGMDYLVVKDFVDSLINNKKMYIDVYDAASWLAITALSEQSLALGSQNVYFPDFTKGKWIYDDKSVINFKS